MIEITNYHWIWYLLGYMFCPRLTLMIFLSIYFKNTLPLVLFIIGWIIAVMNGVSKGGNK